MQINIIYCSQWDYKPKASRAEDEIKKAYKDAEIIIIPSFGGIFEVEINKESFFSKEKEGRFPIDKELVKRIKAWKFSKK